VCLIRVHKDTGGLPSHGVLFRGLVIGIRGTSPLSADLVKIGLLGVSGPTLESMMTTVSFDVWNDSSESKED
jgi:hypothetical protein